jgi:hypothetical protein
MCKQILSCVFFGSLAAAGCTGSGQVTYSGEVQSPRLVEISPGVQVIADADQPIFFNDNYYWRNDGGIWYRSHSHTTGWERVDDAPAPIAAIEQPQMYVHYRGHMEARAVPISNHEARKEIKEERKDAKEQRKDAKEERKEEKHERHLEGE